MSKGEVNYSDLLQAAIKGNNVEDIPKICEKCPKMLDKSFENNINNLLLFYTISLENIKSETFTTLVDKGLDLTGTSKEGFSALTVALKFEKPKYAEYIIDDYSAVLEFLQNKDTKEVSQEIKKLIDKPNLKGETALDYALKLTDKDGKHARNMLLENNANITPKQFSKIQEIMASYLKKGILSEDYRDLSKSLENNDSYRTQLDQSNAKSKNK